MPAMLERWSQRGPLRVIFKVMTFSQGDSSSALKTATGVGSDRANQIVGGSAPVPVELVHGGGGAGEVVSTVMANLIQQFYQKLSYQYRV
jgi:hypothetical protein